MFYNFLLLVHVLAAIIGVGAAFAFPVIMSAFTNVSQLKFTLGIMKKLDLFPKIGGLILLITGLIMGFMSPTYFTHVWFTGSLVLYIIIESLMIGVVDRKLKPVVPIVMNAEGGEIPNEFKDFSKATAPIQMTVHGLALIIIILMSVKPF